MKTNSKYQKLSSFRIKCGMTVVFKFFIFYEKAIYFVPDTKKPLDCTVFRFYDSL